VTKARVHQIDNEVPQNPYWTRREWVNRPPPALAQVDPYGEQNTSLQAGRAEAAKVVANQEAAMAENVASVESLNAAATAEADAKMKQVRDAQIHQRAGEVKHNPYPYVNVALQVEDNEADKMYQEYRKVASAVVAKEHSSEKQRVDAVAAADAKAIADTHKEKVRVWSHHRETMKQYQPWMMVYIPEEEISLAMY